MRTNHQDRFPTASALHGRWQFWSLLVLLVAGVLPTLTGLASIGNYAVPYRSTLYTTIVLHNPVYLVMPMVAALPYASPFWALVDDRFLAQARTRTKIEDILRTHVIRCAVITFAALTMVGLVMAVPMLVEGHRVDPSLRPHYLDSGLPQPETDSGAMTPLVQYGAWALPVVYSLWLGASSSLYALMSLCLSWLQPNRIVALVTPWLGWIVTSIAMAWLGLDRFSPGLLMPFSLVSVSVTGFLVAFAIPLSATGGLLWLTWRHRESLHGCL